eukprot:3532675-Rhodomonas_salina.4
MARSNRLDWSCADRASVCIRRCSFAESDLEHAVAEDDEGAVLHVRRKVADLASLPRPRPRVESDFQD